MDRFRVAVSGLRALLLIAALSVGALANSSSYASFVLNNPNAQLSNSPGPYGTVALQLNNNGTITISVTMDNSFALGGTYGIAGGGPAFGFNGPYGITISGLSSGFSCCAMSGSGYGGFQNVISGPPPAGNAPRSLSFLVSIKGGFNDVGQLGTQFMAHVIPPNGAQTGYATTSMPDGDPSTATLLGLAMLMVSAVIVHRRVTASS